jgi:hypothetical protein
LAARAGDRLVGDRGHATIKQIARLIGIGGEVEIGVEDLALAQFLALFGLRFLDLHHHLALGEDRVRPVDDFGAGGHILLVRRVDAEARTALDPDFVALAGQLVGAFGRQADTVFVILDFLGATDAHGILLLGPSVTTATVWRQAESPERHCRYGCTAFTRPQLGCAAKIRGMLSSPNSHF